MSLNNSQNTFGNNQTMDSNKNMVNNFTGKLNRNMVNELSDLVRVSDKDETSGLELLCYTECNENSSPLLQRCRGVVFAGDFLVMSAFPYTIEYNHEQTELIENIPNFKDCQVFDSYEGTLIRVFNFCGKWYTSTHRKLDAFRSKWSSRESFGESFKRALTTEFNMNEQLRNSCSTNESSDVLEKFQSTLDVNKQYMFLVRNNNENRIVCESAKENTSGLFHVGTFVNGQLVLDENVNIPHSKSHNFNNTTELVNYVRNIDFFEKQGVILFAPENKQYKIVNKKYQDFFHIRGNEPSIKFRYLQIRMEKDKLGMLYTLYPNMHKVFDEYETILYNVARKIYSSYRERHIKKQWLTLPTEEYIVDCTCHRWYLENNKSPVTLNLVIDVMNKQTPTNLNRMIRRYIEESNPSLVRTQKPKSPLLLSKNRMKNSSTNTGNPTVNSKKQDMLPEKLVLTPSKVNHVQKQRIMK